MKLAPKTNSPRSNSTITIDKETYDILVSLKEKLGYPLSQLAAFAIKEFSDNLVIVEKSKVTE